MSSTVEPRFNEGSVPNWQNLLALTRPIRYIEVLFHIFYYYRGEENHSLYRELHYIEDCYIEVPLYLKVRVAYHVRFTDKMEVLSLQGGGVFLH